MGMGQYFQGLDDRIEAQAASRAAGARQSAIDGIASGYARNPNEQAVFDAVNQYAGAEASMGLPQDAVLQAAAAGQREQIMQDHGGWRTPVESLNQAMVDSQAARYGVIGGAALGGGMAMTAGAQKLMDLMGLFEEAGETEVARDQPLTS